MSNHTLKLATGIFGTCGVALGAFGAHALKTRLAAAGHTGTWETAVFYHLIHTVAIFVVAMCPSQATPSAKSRLLTTAAVSWAIGIILFSSSLYVLALGGPRWLGLITPIGGLALLIGWSCVLASGLKKEG
jgi:uncharacterized membrane protein YgdD (TMEM256/DUF423 family)